LFARLLSKLVLEVLPASLASVIGAALLAHYQFGHPAVPAGGMTAVATAPASPEMLQLVRDEHDLIRNFLLAQQAAQAVRYAPADAQGAQAAQTAEAPADAEPAAAAARRAGSVLGAKTPAPRVKAAAIAPLAPAPALAAAVPAAVAAPQALPAVAGLQNSVAPAAPTPALAPEHRSLMARIMSVKDHVVRAPLHAVMTIGGIPSWLGHRLGSDEPDPSEQMFSAAS
jgi:hypothetical protein